MENIKINVEPKISMIDKRVSVTVEGLAPGEKAIIRAYSPDYYRIVKKKVTQGIRIKEIGWQSWGMFVADQWGKIDLSAQMPTAGTYASADGMGLFWSMRASGRTEYALSAKLSEIPVIKSMQVVFEVKRGGNTAASCTCSRLFLKEGIEKADVTENGLIARFFNEPSPAPKPGVIVLGGSDGSIFNAQRLAGVLASHGYAALALAYYGMEQLPPSLQNIPVEYVEKATAWIKAKSEVDSGRILIFGKSKGGELALLAGSLIPDIRGVIASVPCPIAFEGLNRKGRNGGASSWSYRNKPLPYLKFKVNPFTFGLKCLWNIMTRKSIPIETAGLYLRALEDKEQVRQAFFPIEKTNGPILLISSAADFIWPSKKLAEMAVRRLESQHFPFPYRHVSYPAGHFIFIPYEPITRAETSPEQVAFADRDSWENILSFLEKIKE